jgi:hypothetical protein
MPKRMLEYWIWLHRRYGHPVEQMVLYLKRTRSTRVRIDRLQIGTTSHRYAVVRLWEQPAGPLRAAQELLPLATLARSTPANEPPLLDPGGRSTLPHRRSRSTPGYARQLPSAGRPRSVLRIDHPPPLHRRP